MIAISTAYKQALIAVDINGKRSEKMLDSSCAHSENILLTLDQMLDQMGYSIKDNRELAVVVGPGSFTGLRIALALAKGLSAGLDIEKIIPITTFELMAYSYIRTFKPTDDFICVINGLSGHFFVCEYAQNGEKKGKERMVEREELSLIKLKTVGLEEERCAEVLIQPSPQDLLEVAFQNRSHACDVKSIAPLYLRKSQAEDSLDEKLKKNNKI